MESFKQEYLGRFYSELEQAKDCLARIVLSQSAELTVAEMQSLRPDIQFDTNAVVLATMVFMSGENDLQALTVVNPFVKQSRAKVRNLRQKSHFQTAKGLDVIHTLAKDNSSDFDYYVSLYLVPKTVDTYYGASYGRWSESRHKAASELFGSRITMLN